MDQKQLATELNPAQIDAVTYCDGPSLVIAGAGSGKTRVLTYKIAYLLENGYKPWNLMALTFTNKAAREMNSRIAQLCTGTDIRGIWSGTFHSLFARILRTEHASIDYPADFTIYDTSDSRSLLKAIVREMELDDKIYKPAALGARISEAKNHLILPAQYSRDPGIASRDQADRLTEMSKIYEQYQHRLRSSSAMDFDDLLLNTYLLLHDNIEIRKHYKERFQYILVDEFQDTNRVQHQILTLLTDRDSRICVVGDDAQSIYGFRGADISNILNFKTHYPSARIIKLECNYRSTQNIVEAANSVIGHNLSQIPKKVFAAGETGDRIEVFNAQTDKEEAKKVVSHIEGLKYRKGVPQQEIAVLYRTNAQSRSLEEAFQNAQIPYRIYGGLSFYQRKEIKDVLGYFRLATNLDDEEAFRRIINYPQRGIGATTQQKVMMAASRAAVSPWKVARQPADYGLKISTATRHKLDAFCDMIESFHDMATQLSASDIAEKIIRTSGIAADITADHDADSISRQENVDELLSSIHSFEEEQRKEQGTATVSLAEFLRTVSLYSDNEDRNDSAAMVTLMTVHAAKGLEYEAVFITGLEDDLFPNANARIYPKEMEEERRLFYVALTRAKRYCFLSYANTRFRYGSLQFSDPSAFIDEIAPQYLIRKDDHAPMSHSGFSQTEAHTERTFTQDANPFPSLQPSNQIKPKQAPAYGRGHPISLSSAIASSTVGKSKVAIPPVGSRIDHERFGPGTVVDSEGTGDSAKIKVRFDQAGTKNLLVKFAKFKLLPMG